jgi:hypothetical protein
MAISAAMAAKEQKEAAKSLAIIIWESFKDLFSDQYENSDTGLAVSIKLFQQLVSLV